MYSVIIYHCVINIIHENKNNLFISLSFEFGHRLDIIETDTFIDNKQAYQYNNNLKR